MPRILVVAPHPDDEILGCGGVLLRRRAEGCAVGWLLMTGISEADGWPAERVRTREDEIARVAKMVGFDFVENLRLPTTRLDTLPMADVVAKMAAAVEEFRPTDLLIPHRGDAHSDHRVTFDAAAACTKWFRHASIERVLAYETPSETDFGLDLNAAFVPTVFTDITAHLERKLEIMSVYRSELGAAPFPRSLEGLRALATVRGSACGFAAAEAFQLLRERQT